MNSPLISIIVPVYNTEKYLDQCIQSVLAQTYTNWELLLIDDGSTDSSGAICDRYAEQDSRIRVFHKPNGGVSSARNLGLDNARGEWITFVDSDDWVKPCWLSNYDICSNFCYDLISQGFETDIPVFNTLEPRQKSYTYALDNEGSIAEVMEEIERSKTIGFLWIKLFKANLIRARHITFNEQLAHGEDYIFIYHYLSEAKTIKAVRQIGYHYNVPQWAKKYTQDFSWNVLVKEALYKYTLRIMANSPRHNLVRQRREDLTSIYIEEFRENTNHRFFCLKRLRAILQKQFIDSQLFFLTKLIILIDPTYFISSLILRLHISIKNKAQQWI